MALRPGDDRGDAGDSMLEKDVQKQEFTGICQSCLWFKQSPLRRWTFGVMLLFALLTPIWLIIRATGTLTGDILSGLAGFILACYGANHFRILLGLKEQVNIYISHKIYNIPYNHIYTKTKKRWINMQKITESLKRKMLC